MEDNHPQSVDRRISIKAIAERCGLEVRKMSSPVIKVKGIKIHAVTRSFTTVQHLKEQFKSLRELGIGRIYLYDLKEAPYKDPSGAQKPGYIVRYGYHKDVGAGRVTFDEKLRVIEKRMKHFSLSNYEKSNNPQLTKRLKERQASKRNQ